MRLIRIILVVTLFFIWSEESIMIDPDDRRSLLRTLSDLRQQGASEVANEQRVNPSSSNFPLTTLPPPRLQRLRRKPPKDQNIVITIDVGDRNIIPLNENGNISLNIKANEPENEPIAFEKRMEIDSNEVPVEKSQEIHYKHHSKPATQVMHKLSHEMELLMNQIENISSAIHSINDSITIIHNGLENLQLSVIDIKNSTKRIKFFDLFTSHSTAILPLRSIYFTIVTVHLGLAYIL